MIIVRLLQAMGVVTHRACSYYVHGTRPRQNVLETSSRYTSVQIASTAKCSRYPFVQI